MKIRSNCVWNCIFENNIKSEVCPINAVFCSALGSFALPTKNGARGHNEATWSQTQDDFDPPASMERNLSQNRCGNVRVCFGLLIN